MSGLLIAADPGRLTTAAGYLAGASEAPAAATLPSLGDPGAEASMGRFASVVGGYHAGLCQAAGTGADLLVRWRSSFVDIGG